MLVDWSNSYAIRKKSSMGEPRKVSLIYRASGLTCGQQRYRVTIKKIDSEYRLKCTVVLPDRFYRDKNSSECVHVEWFDQSRECLKTAQRLHEHLQQQKGTLRRRDREQCFTKHRLPDDWMDSPDLWLRKGDVICRRMDGLLGVIGLWHGAIYIGNGDIVHNAVTQSSIGFVSSLMKHANDVKVSDLSDFSDGRRDTWVIEWLESTKSEDEMVKSAKSLVREQNWLTMFGTLQIVEKTS
ncbi:hypothetical protein PRIPAC_71457 [Pristionchus pacificus]|uniref:Uncharacterized protein n=1 Tax=Pristionchus pacificus TaxID=54126 RepID=A0A2A6C566_PRIPA|nr:hypothetical protein PRIPAC_71457 [Pristionchus pacificus]|eukprot:PDM73314.1 hypothetical protein PRIPAC_40670 [Pristionchus pacificus]